MAEPSAGLPGLVVLGALLACATPSPERLLDNACLDGACPTTGSARQTTGLTADSIGFELGPGPGSVTIAVPSGSSFTTDQLDLLVRGSGQLLVTIRASSCSPACSTRSIELTKNWRWATMEGKSSTFTSSVPGLEIVIETQDESSEAALLDFRFH
jgi:hypothetical protein